MKRNLLATLVIGLLLVPATFAQHGHGGMGPMGSGNMGNAGNMGNSGNVGRDNGLHGNPNGTTSGQKSPEDLLNQNTKLASNLDNLLKPYNMTAQQACQGFKNLGQCVAAIHVSHNLKNVNFNCLKWDMTGVAAPSGTSCPSGTGSKIMGLGQSIQQLDPQANAKSEASTAKKQASQDLKSQS
jgi:hypothetical protein